jgi:hypothetical protein
LGVRWDDVNDEEKLAKNEEILEPSGFTTRLGEKGALNMLVNIKKEDRPFDDKRKHETKRIQNDQELSFMEFLVPNKIIKKEMIS